jgi:hypothetical protein
MIFTFLFTPPVQAIPKSVTNFIDQQLVEFNGKHHAPLKEEVDQFIETVYSELARKFDNYDADKDEITSYINQRIIEVPKNKTTRDEGSGSCRVNSSDPKGGKQAEELAEYLKKLSLNKAFQNDENSNPEPFIFTPVTPTLAEKEFYQTIKAKLVNSPFGSKLLDKAQDMNFQFAGFIPSSENSKANTDPKTRHIRIRETTDHRTATLSLAYELSNVINSPRYVDIFSNASNCTIDANTYANKITEIEAEAILRRSLVAHDLSLGDLVVNQRYHAIATKPFVGMSERAEELLNLMRREGTVGPAKTPVLEHYKNLFKKHYPQCAEKPVPLH